MGKSGGLGVACGLSGETQGGISDRCSGGRVQGLRWLCQKSMNLVVGHTQQLPLIGCNFGIRASALSTVVST